MTSLRFAQEFAMVTRNGYKDSLLNNPENKANGVPNGLRGGRIS
jgi:hypothetical protein